MRFTPGLLDEIKTRLPVSEVVRRRVKLTKAGREWRGLSPFTQEKSPSFFVNDQKMAWFDFSSGQNGNIFDFLIATEGLSFREAVERLAAEAGVSLPVSSPEVEQREKRRASLQEVVEIAAKFFEDQLAGRFGVRARAYLAERGLGPEIQKVFRLGYSPNERYALRDHLASKGASAETMIEAGLLVHGEDIAVPYDRFRDRVMFPICDRSGRTIAFGGRAMSKEVQAKYLNSPETPLFHKGGVLYNHHNARKTAHDKGTVIAVEGYVDVISMSAVGFGHVVAPLGTALTPDQIQLMWTMAPEPILCFDGDRAGRKAANRAIDVALPLIGPDRSLRFAFLPEGQDPDDLARSGGSEAIAGVLGAARPLVDVLWSREVEAQPLDTPERRAALERRLGELMQLITDEPLRRYYRDEIRDRLSALRGGGARPAGQPGAPAARPGGFARAPAAGGRRRGFAPEPPRGYVGAPIMISPGLARTKHFAGQAAIPGREAGILVLFMRHPDLLDRYAEDLGTLELDNRDLQRLRGRLMQFATEGHSDREAVMATLEARGEGPLCRRLEAVAQGAFSIAMRESADVLDVEFALRQALALHRRARSLHRELASAAVALAESPSDENFARLREIQTELAGLDGREAVAEGLGSSDRPPEAKQ